MDQNVSVEEVLNNSFATIYDVLKLVDSSVNDIVINNLNNNADSDEILRLKQFKEAYIKAMEETRILQGNIINLFSYVSKDLNEIKQEEMVNEPVQDNQIEFNNELVNNYDVTQNVVEEPVTYEAPVEEMAPVTDPMEVPVEDVSVENVVEMPAEDNAMETPEEDVVPEEVPVETNEVENVEDIVVPDIAVTDTPAEVTEEVNEVENPEEIVIPDIAADTPTEVVEEAPVAETSEEIAIPAIAGLEPKEEAQAAEVSFDGVENKEAEEPIQDQAEGVVLPSIAVPSEESVEEANDDTLKIFKTSNDAPKVILVTSIQYDKLKLSKDSKKALLHAKGIIGDGEELEEQLVQNGLLEGSVEDKQQQVQQLIAEAQELYKEGKTVEAQEKMNQVTVLNEEIKNSAQQVQVAA